MSTARFLVVVASAYGAIFFGGFFAWRHERQKVIRLQEQQEKRIHP